MTHRSVISQLSYTSIVSKGQVGPLLGLSDLICARLYWHSVLTTAYGTLTLTSPLSGPVLLPLLILVCLSHVIARKGLFGKCEHHVDLGTEGD